MIIIMFRLYNIYIYIYICMSTHSEDNTELVEDFYGMFERCLPFTWDSPFTKGFPFVRDFPFIRDFLQKRFPFTRDFLQKRFPFTRDSPS